MDATKKYFDSKNLFLETNENFANALNNNEPKGGGKDYILWTSPDRNHDDESDTDEREAMHLQLTARLKNAFEQPKTYKNNFGFDTDSDTDENCLKIQDKKQPAAEQTDHETERLVSTFNLVVRTTEEVKANEKLSNQEIMRRLENPDFMSTAEHVAKLSKAVKKCMAGFDFFKEQMGEAIYVEEHGEQESTTHSLEQSSSLEVPSITQESASSIDESGNKSRSSSSPSPLKEIQGQRKPRSKKNVDQPTVNVRMNKFVRQFTQTRSAKRRRTSTSPQPRP